MAKRLQLRRGTQAQHVTFTGALGEVTVDTTRKALILHDGATTGGILITSTGTPLGSPLWHNGARASIETGYLSMDGQLLSRATYPILWAKIQSSFNFVNDTLWLANNGKRSCYSSGDGSTTFRMPDLNGISAGAFKAPVLRGDGYAASGTVLGDAIRDIEGHTNWMSYVNAVQTQYNGSPSMSGAFYAGEARGNTVSGANWTSPLSSPDNQPLAFKASLTVPTADENRPVSAFGVWICRVGDTTAEAGDPSTNAVLTGGNTFNGSQQINGNVNATDITASGKLKGTLDPATLNSTGTAPFYGCRAWVNFNPVPLYGTYSQAGTTVTVTMTAHGMAVGQKVSLTPTSGTGISGTYTVLTVATNTFTYTAGTSLTTSGNMTRNLFIRGSGNILGITDNGVGDYSVLFITPMPDLNYCSSISGNSAGNGAVLTMPTEYGGDNNAASFVRTASAVRLIVTATGGGQNGAMDLYNINVAIFR